jgi:hypothetical protein
MRRARVAKDLRHLKKLSRHPSPEAQAFSHIGLKKGVLYNRKA